MHGSSRGEERFLSLLKPFFSFFFFPAPKFVSSGSSSFSPTFSLSFSQSLIKHTYKLTPTSILLFFLPFFLTGQPFNGP